jgi:hypothetical protein
VRACFDKLSMTIFDKLSMTIFDKLSMTGKEPAKINI